MRFHRWEVNGGWGCRASLYIRLCVYERATETLDVSEETRNEANSL